MMTEIELLRDLIANLNRFFDAQGIDFFVEAPSMTFAVGIRNGDHMHFGDFEDAVIYGMGLLKQQMKADSDE